ncbi:MAG: Xaa-Pro dipeptidase, partial [Planctomycetales bacterium]|nr:Xaa-Pro dipeptidase [Planctomycetales bacterium]
MTLTVDFPNMEPGWGATHLEDLVVITADGAKPLATMDSPLVVGG